MEWGVVHGWINTLILGVIGLAVLAHVRWRRFRWFVCYALVSTVMAVVYKSWFLNNYDFYLIKYLTGNLLLLGALLELLRKEAEKFPAWAWLALAGIVVVPFLPIDYNLKLFLPIYILNIGQAAELSTAIRVRNPLLLGLTIMGTAYAVGNTIKLFIDWREFLLAFRILDPWFYTGATIFILSGIFWPEIIRSTRRIANGFSSLYQANRPVPVASNSASTTSQAREHNRPADIYSFPVKTGSEWETPLGEPGALRFLMDEVLERFDSMEDALKVAAAISMSTRKTFLSISDLAVYLGVEAEVAGRFVEHRGIPKIRLTDDPKDWVVARSAVDEVLIEAQ
ncbi:MAG TPA: hypothetical protein VMX35_13160 [Acidobacteriota bacterium]|nr:hypothetical protein [Acidobacteriota bacterium]